MVGDSPKSEGIIIIQKGLEIKQNNYKQGHFHLFSHYKSNIQYKSGYQS